MEILLLQSATPGTIIDLVQSKGYQGIIDIGAYLTSLSAEEIAKKMAEKMPTREAVTTHCLRR